MSRNNSLKETSETSSSASSVDDAIAAIEADRQRRANECEREFQELLKQHRCTLQFVGLLFQGGQLVPQFRIAAQ